MDCGRVIIDYPARTLRDSRSIKHSHHANHHVAEYIDKTSFVVQWAFHRWSYPQFTVLRHRAFRCIVQDSMKYLRQQLPKMESIAYNNCVHHDFMAKFGYTERVTRLLYRTTRSNP